MFFIRFRPNNVEDYHLTKIAKEIKIGYFWKYKSTPFRSLTILSVVFQEDFLRTFPVDKHPKLWSVVPLAIFTPSLLSAIVPEAVAMTTKVLDTWLISSERTVTDCQTLVSRNESR